MRKRLATRAHIGNWAETATGDKKDIVIRQKIFETITDVFKRHGGVTIDTPVFELKVPFPPCG